MPSGSFNHFPAAIQALHAGSVAAADALAKELAAQVQTNAPVLSGYMRDSVYTVTSEGSTYQSGDKSLPEVPAPDAHTAVVAVAASYASYVNGGTSRQAAQPFFTSAVEAMRGKLASEAAAKINQALGAAL